MSGTEAAVIAAAVLFAACCQACIGFGIGMLAAPIVALIDPSLIPATLILVATVVTLVVTVLDRDGIDLHGTGWALLGRLPGTVVGALLVAAMPERALALALGGVVVGGIVLTSFGWAPTPTRPALVAAGAASGVLGTATSIGGPAMALVWQRSEGAALRGTMNGFFLIGSVVSVIALAATGATSSRTYAAFVLLIPAAIVGVVLSRYVNRWLDRERLRLVAIAVSSAGALVLLGQHLV
ncbi:MAG: sulfite exporter TauE/SafE family protein [Nocardioidaceae bacterium]